MLVLSRNVGQKIVIGDEEIIIQVKQISNRQVKLSFDAPSKWTIHRKEIYDKIKAGSKKEYCNGNT